eukprot:CAMPEP_0179041576 /NCGR_PEP_ID=MMETSP0796-20121207/16228_1 /TAXON_ID=73915 /ORGANISM="Pyrodinium bahamense, Strain pbaha01" /LENGTH=335 /DNA_ID=CAMNT_0020737945 /DNA_START=69 /DNA_END=1072 /DNA_ORIENTATION=+
MMRGVAVAGALFVPSKAFVPSGNLRASQPSQTIQGPADIAATEVAVPSPQQTSAQALGLVGLTAAGLAIGAARSSSRLQQAARRVERRVVGVCLPLTEKWDPLNLGSTDAKMDRYTAVEIKHGRISMIACLGYWMPEIFRFPGCESFENGLGALSTLPVEGWVQLIAFIGAHEVLIRPRADGMGSFDLGLGTELLEGITEEELERRQTVERNNGRLAMIGIMGLMVQDGMFGQTPLELWKSGGWWGPSVDFFIKDIPICMGTSLCALDANEEVRMSEAVPFLKYPAQLDGWVGAEKGFDPLGVTDALPVYLVREAELKHGRVCMLATVGWIATDL